ncbi:hypothetical protein MHPYR_440056 [uncultured Mycobacterium sp.]|uniref:Uncharacterized protein n=1 Tax=uncultured Mycobacterium sp. TaxID=171292 RepID=A0A1Y5PFT9_9MYCO|nr:hypothetical protein MHPYR_440056 [uncultured Mycobacterium sp.]
MATHGSACAAERVGRGTPGTRHAPGRVDRAGARTFAHTPTLQIRYSFAANLLTSHVWRQDHNGFSHQDPGFIDHLVNKKAAAGPGPIRPGPTVGNGSQHGCRHPIPTQPNHQRSHQWIAPAINRSTIRPLRPAPAPTTG